LQKKIMTQFNTFPPTSRIWIYQSNQPIPTEKTVELTAHIQQFTQQWTAHNQALRAYGELRDQRFIILMVDESQAGASGCSIDKSVHFVKHLEQAFGLNLFDRMTFTYQENGEIKAAPREEFAQLFAEGIINEETLVFDNLVKNKEEFEKSWVKKLGESWHKRMV
jgi:hypothetical protein